MSTHLVVWGFYVLFTAVYVEEHITKLGWPDQHWIRSDLPVPLPTRLAMAQELWEKAFPALLKVISEEHSHVSWVLILLCVCASLTGVACI